jgi:hypothetical protein
MVYPVMLLVLMAGSASLAARSFLRMGAREASAHIAEIALTNFVPAVCLMAMLPLLALVFERDKITGVMESPLASPAGVGVTLAGRACFVVLWSFGWALAYLGATAAVLASMGVIPPPAAGTRIAIYLALTPLVSAAAVLLFSELSMIATTRLTGFGGGLMAGALIYGSSMGVLSPASAAETALVMGLVAVSLLLLSISLLPALSPERIILRSGKN